MNECQPTSHGGRHLYGQADSYLSFEYFDKVQILTVAANALKDKPFLDSQIFMSDDVSKNRDVRKDRAKLQKDYLKGIKERMC